MVPLVPLPTYEVLPPDDDTVFVTEMVSVLLAELSLPRASVKVEDATEIDAVPPLDGDAVKVAVYVVPLPEKLLSVPSVTVISVESNVDVDLPAVNVMVDVAPDAIDAALEVIVIVGAAVS